MKHSLITTLSQILTFIFLTPLFFTWGCSSMSETIEDKSAGFNGGFEITKSGLPVNWQVYTPNTIKDSDFDIIIDTEDFKEGNNLSNLM